MEAFSALERLINQHAALTKAAGVKRANDGLNSSVPEDPKGDGTVEPHTGELFDTMDSEIEDNPFVDITAMDESQANTSDPVDDLGNIGTEVMSVDDHVVDEYNMDVPDPGTDSPVKTSSYARFTFAQNHQAFNKCASILLKDMNERSAGVKTAAARTECANVQPTLSDYDLLRAYDMIQKTAAYDAQIAAANLAKVLRKEASGEEISIEDVPVDPAVDVPVEEAIPAEDAAALSELPPEVVDTLIEMPEPQLAMLEEVAGAVDAGQISPDEAIAILTDAGVGAAPAKTPAPAADVPAEEKDDTGSESASEGSDTETKEAAFRRRKRAFRLMRKIAQEAPLTEEDVALASEVSPEDIAAIEALPDEAIADLIALDEAVASGAIPEEVAIQALQGDPAVDAALAEAAETLPPEAALPEEAVVEELPEEAVAGFSDALAEQGVSPEELAAVASEVPDTEKSAALRKIANSVHRYRYYSYHTKRAGYSRPKTARSAAIKMRCHRVLNELLN